MVGEFFNDSKTLHYLGGSEEMSYLERDKICLLEILGYLGDHCEVVDGILLHWLFPGKDLVNGLRVLVDDKVCQYTSDYTTDGSVGDIYVEAAAVTDESDEEKGSENDEDEDGDFEEEMEALSEKEEDDEEQELMASPPPPPPAWSVTLCLRHRGGLEIHAAAENILPGWGHGGERLSFLLRLRRRLRLAVTSHCVRAPALTEPKPRACKILHFLRIRWARVPGVPSIWRRKKRPPERAAAAKPGSRSQNRALMRPAHRERVWMAKATTVLCVVAVLAAAAASIAVFRLTTGYHHCTPWRGFLAKRFVEFLEPPPLYEWLPKTSLKWLLNK